MFSRRHRQHDRVSKSRADKGRVKVTCEKEAEMLTVWAELLRYQGAWTIRGVKKNPMCLKHTE